MSGQSNPTGVVVSEYSFASVVNMFHHLRHGKPSNSFPVSVLLNINTDPALRECCLTIYPDTAFWSMLVRGYHAQLSMNSLFLLKLLKCSLISVAFFTRLSIYWDPSYTVVSSKTILWPFLYYVLWLWIYPIGKGVPFSLYGAPCLPHIQLITFTQNTNLNMLILFLVGWGMVLMLYLVNNLLILPQTDCLHGITVMPTGLLLGVLSFCFKWMAQWNSLVL